MMGKGGWQLRRPAPLLGQHTGEVLAEAGLGRSPSRAPTEAAR